MPKIIDIDENKILEITKNIIQEGRYKDLSCRNISNECHIAVGTIYHFFKSKDEIIAKVILNDWHNYLENININTSLINGIENIYNNIYSFSKKYISLWEYCINESKINVFSSKRHNILIKQVETLIKNCYEFNKIKYQETLINFISENIVSYSSHLIDFNNLKDIFIKLIN